MNYKKTSLYESYKFLERSYYNNEAKAYKDLRNLYMGTFCHDYVDDHPQSPFREELLAIAAILDGDPGSYSWKIDYQEKFNSQQEVWASAKYKMRVWLETHCKDADVLTLLAAVLKLSYCASDEALPNVCDYLFQALQNSERCNYAIMWAQVAHTIDFSEIKQQAQMYSSRHPGKHMELFKNNTIKSFLVLFSWAAFFFCTAGVCLPFICIKTWSFSINWYAAQMFSFSDTIKTVAAGVIILNFAVFVNNTAFQNMAFYLSVAGILFYVTLGSICIGYATGINSDIPTKIALFGNKPLLLILVLVLSRDIGKSIYWTQHIKPPKIHPLSTYSYSECAFILVCIGISLAGTVLWTNPQRFYPVVLENRALLILLWCMPLIIVLLRRFEYGTYLSNAWYSAGMLICFCILTDIPVLAAFYANPSNLVYLLKFIVILTLAVAFSFNMNKQIERDMFALYVPITFICIELLQIIALEEIYISFDDKYPDVIYKTHTSVYITVGLAVYISLREYIVTMVVRKRSEYK